MILRLPESIDPGIRPLVEILNEMGHKTISSCEGHPRGCHVYFQSDEIPGWIDPVMASLQEMKDVCLGCWRPRIEFAAYFDCSNEPKKYWIIQIEPRQDMKLKDKDKKIIDEMISRITIKLKEWHLKNKKGD